jgi:hypothetical protein
MSPVLGIIFRSAGRYPKKIMFEGDSKTTNLVVAKSYKKPKITISLSVPPLILNWYTPPLCHPLCTPLARHTCHFVAGGLHMSERMWGQWNRL